MNDDAILRLCCGILIQTRKDITDNRVPDAIRNDALAFLDSTWYNDISQGVSKEEFLRLCKNYKQGDTTTKGKYERI